MVATPGVAVMPSVRLRAHTVFPYTPVPGYPGYTTRTSRLPVTAVHRTAPRRRGALGSGPPFPAGEEQQEVRLRTSVLVSSVDRARSTGLVMADPG